MATKADILRMAHRHLRVLSADEALTAEQEQYASDILDSLWAEVQEVEGVTGSIDAPADALVLPLSHLLAVEVAPHYNRQAPWSRSRAIGRLRALTIPNDATDRRDSDGDGIVDDDEAAAGLRTAYY